MRSRLRDLQPKWTVSTDSMTALPRDKLDRLFERWMAIQDELNHGVSQAAYVKLTKEFSDLSPVAAQIEALRKAESEDKDLEQLIREFRERKGRGRTRLRRANGAQ